MQAVPCKRSWSCSALGGPKKGKRVKREDVQAQFEKWRRERQEEQRAKKQFYPALPSAEWAERRHRLLHAKHSAEERTRSRWIFRMFATQAAAFEFADSMNTDFFASWPRPTAPDGCNGPGAAAVCEDEHTSGRGVKKEEKEEMEEERARALVTALEEQQREEAHVFAFEKAGGEEGGGRRAYAVCTYSSLWSLYSRPYEREEEPLQAKGTRSAGEAVPRNFYEVLREGRPAQLYFDLEYSYRHGENREKDAGEMIYWLKRTLCHAFMAHYGIPCSEAQVLDLYSPSETKFSMHMLLRAGHLSAACLPGGCLELALAFASNLQCGRFVQLLLLHLREGTAVQPHPRKAEFFAAFLAQLRAAIAAADEDSPLLALPTAELLQRVYHREIGRDMHSFSVGTCVRGCLPSAAAAALKAPSQVVAEPSSTPAWKQEAIDDETLADLLAVMDEAENSQDVPPAHASPVQAGDSEEGSASVEVTRDFSELRTLFEVATEKGRGWFIDTGVYTRNRNFRLLGSHKQGRFHSPLLLSPTSTYILPAAGAQVKAEPRKDGSCRAGRDVNDSTQEELSEVRHFVACQLGGRDAFSVAASAALVADHAGDLSRTVLDHSLVCKELASCHDVPPVRLTCPFRMLPGVITAWSEEEEASPSGGPAVGGYRYGPGVNRSSFPALDAFIDAAVAEEGGRTRSWLQYPATRTVVYQVTGMPCGNIGRLHKSNGTTMVANLNIGTFFQKCLDPDCREQGYKGVERRLPEEVLATIPGFESQLGRRDLPSTGTSRLYSRTKAPWQEDDRLLAEALAEDPDIWPT